jgi:hypothetical protein
VGELIGWALGAGRGAAYICPYVDEADNDVVRFDTQRTLHYLVVGWFAGSPHGAQSLGKGGEHDAVSGRAGRHDLLDDGDLRGSVASCCDHDDQGCAQGLGPFSSECLVAGEGVPARQSLGQNLTKDVARVPLDEHEPPGSEAAVVRDPSGTLEHRLDGLR